MFPLSPFFFLLSLALHAAAGADRRPSEPDPGPPAGFRSLFNGRDLTGWDGSPRYCSVEDGALPAARDARAYEKQAEVRTFTSDVLAGPVEWTGKVTAELYVTSTAKDTDFIVRVSDVYPDGRSILLIDYVRRARYREGFDREALMEPGKVYRVAFQVGWLSQVFNRGHRIRVTVASTGALFYEPNPNTGEPLTLEWPARTVVAENTVQHNRRYASKRLAPVVRPDPRPERARGRTAG